MPDVEDNNVNIKIDPPPHSEIARMARFIVHTADWAVVSYRSLHPKTNDYPMGIIQSVSDGPVNNSKGKPYLYVTELEDVIQDTDKDNRCTLTMSLAQTDYCSMKQLDPESPLCAQVWLVGRINRVEGGSAEEKFAREALFSRHPSMENWPKDHKFFFMKHDIEQVVIQDYFGGPVYVNVTDYYNASP